MILSENLELPVSSRETAQKQMDRKWGMWFCDGIGALSFAHCRGKKCETSSIFLFGEDSNLDEADNKIIC
jgi:hypothetical protein